MPICVCLVLDLVKLAGMGFFLVNGNVGQSAMEDAAPVVLPMDTIFDFIGNIKAAHCLTCNTY